MQALGANSAERFVGTLWGAAIGDAMGWPFEARANPLRTDRIGRSGPTPDDIFTGWIKQSGGRFRPYQETIERGEYSDDTQLIIAVARSRLSNCEWWRRLAEAELPFWTMYQRGGGGATLRATKHLLNGELPWEARNAAAVRKYFDAGGNGVAMRIAPHCLVHAQGSNFDDLAKDILTDGVLTHGHPRALVGALAYGFSLWWALQNSEILRYGELIKESLQAVHLWSALPDLDDRWPTWNRSANNAEFRGQWTGAVHEQLEALSLADDALGAGALAVDQETLTALGCFDRRVNGAGTVNAAAATFLASRHAASPMEGVTRAARARGADTDTLASMTGALLGAVAGTDWLFPFVRLLQDHAYIRSLADGLLRSEPSERPYRKFRTRDATNFLQSLKRGGLQVEVPINGPGMVTPYGGIRAKSPKLEAHSWKIRFEGQTIFVTDIRQRAAELPLDVSVEKIHSSFSGVAISVSDLSRSLSFYTQVLGLPVTRRTDKFVSLGQLALRSSPSAVPSAGVFTLFIEVDDPRRSHQILQYRGLPMSELVSRSGRESFVCRDPDGYLIEVVQRSASDNTHS